jgi:DNA-directed RNA polymerase subunit E'/Rpb7
MNKDEKKEYGVYINSMLSKKVVLKITEIGKNIKQNLEKKIKYSIEGKCIVEGFIRPKTVEVVSYSCGLVKDDHIEFQVIYRCLVCNPIKDIEMECFVKNITKAGIHAEVRDNEDNVPITIFVARDHNYTNSMFDTIEKDMIIRVKIIGVRFELNDPSITAIAYLLDKKEAEKPIVKVKESEYVNEFVKDTEYVKENDNENDNENEEFKYGDETRTEYVNNLRKNANVYAIKIAKELESYYKQTGKDKDKKLIKDEEYSPELPKYMTAWEEDNAIIDKMEIDKKRLDLNREIMQGLPMSHYMYFPKRGEPGFKEELPVVYDEDEIFKRPRRKIIVRK